MSWWLIKQVQLNAKFPMQLKADMVPKDYGFNQSETASCLCMRVSRRFPCSPAMARDGELIQTQYFCHHANTIFHPNSSYVTTNLYETSACGCNNNMIFQNELFSRFLPSTYVAWQRRSLGDAAKVARWQHWWIHNFSCLTFRFCVTTMLWLYCKVVQWYSMRLECISGYYLNLYL